VSDLPRVLEQLVALRHEAKLSQRAVADSIGTQQSAISEMERGIASPTLGTLTRYARRFGMEITLVPAAHPTEEGTTHG
jgi:transcriptional regulator with XRE-family HTH domain